MPAKILIVEDDRAIRQSVLRLLARDGYYTAAHETTEAALAQIDTDPTFDLALIDVNLPGRDGFACCRMLRGKGWRKPVIMLTGRSSSADKVSGLSAGADDYVTKPFDPPELRPASPPTCAAPATTTRPTSRRKRSVSART